MPRTKTTLLIAALSVTFLALGVTTVAEAQGVMFVKNNRVGIGTSTPAQPLHVRSSDGSARLQVSDHSGATAERTLMQLGNRGPVRFTISDSSSAQSWSFKTAGPAIRYFDISKDGTGVAEFRVDAVTGNLTIQGDVITNNCPSGCGPDYVFEPDYELMSLAELEAFVNENRHLPRIPPANEMASAGVNMSELQIRLLEKVEELTLHTIAQQKEIELLKAQLAK